MNKIKTYTKQIIKFSSMQEQFPKYKELFDSIRSSYLGKFALISIYNFTVQLQMEQQPCIRHNNYKKDVETNESDKKFIKEIIDFLYNNYLDCLIDFNQ